MTLEELQVQFDALAEPVLSAPRREVLKSQIFELENCADVGKLMALSVADE